MGFTAPLMLWASSGFTPVLPSTRTISSRAAPGLTPLGWQAAAELEPTSHGVALPWCWCSGRHCGSQHSLLVSVLPARPHTPLEAA